jgi:hypothetical protein
MLAGSEGGHLVFLLALIVGFVVVSAVMSSRRETAERLQQAANRIGAGFEQGGAFKLPTLTVQVRDNAGRLTFAEGKEAHTLLALGVPEYRGGSLSINPETFVGLFWVDDLRIGDRRFDEDFVVQAHPPELASWIFAPQRRAEVIATIRRLTRYGGVSIQIRAGSLEVRVDSCLKDEAALRSLLQTASELIGYMLTAPGDSGIVWGESLERLTGSCPVCSAPLGAPIRRCERCQAPHHAECFEYLGRCAIFGCEPQPRRRAA